MSFSTVSQNVFGSMVFRVGLLAIAVVLIDGHLVARAQTTANDITHIPGPIRRAVEDAKAAGKTETDVTIVAGDYPRVSTLPEALRLTTPVAVHVSSKKTILSGGDSTLLTLYTVHIIDNIFELSLPNTNATPDPATFALFIPDMSSADTAYVITHGGTAVIDGVAVRVPENPAPLNVNGYYLLFLRFEKSREGTLTRFATLALGDAGIYKYDVSTGRFSPVGRKHNQDLVSKLLSNSGHLYSSLRVTLAENEHSAASGVRR